ncbi:MAG TPA: hypothetical protein VLO29_06810, partial [Salegentibacter sp.]|nr:hypothetical protein [Salegentibacter sp.]
VSPSGRDTLFTKISEMERDSLKITAVPSGNIEFDQTFKFRANTPLVESNADLIRILDKDSAEVNFTADLQLIKNELQLQFEKEENNQYQIRALPGALTDLFGKTNDTINQQISTKPYSEYGSVMLRLQNVNSFPIITQLTDLEGKVQAERFSENETSFNFRFLKPAKYLVRVIIDDNGNHKWDTGNYLKKQKPEKIHYYNDTLEVRSNWDLNESFILE